VVAGRTSARTAHTAVRVYCRSIPTVSDAASTSRLAARSVSVAEPAGGARLRIGLARVADALVCVDHHAGVVRALHILSAEIVCALAVVARGAVLRAALASATVIRGAVRVPAVRRVRARAIRRFARLPKRARVLVHALVVKALATRNLRGTSAARGRWINTRTARLTLHADGAS
jgi:hypothetical protein